MKYGSHQIDKAGDILISSKNTEEVSTYSMNFIKIELHFLITSIICIFAMLNIFLTSLSKEVCLNQ